MMGAPAFEIREADLGSGWVEACFWSAGYISPSTGAYLAVEPGVDADRRRMWELVAHGLTLSGFQERFFCLMSLEPDHLRPGVLDALDLVLWAMEPGWVAAVEDARRVADCPRVLAAFVGVPLEVALAVCYPLSGPSKAA